MLNVFKIALIQNDDGIGQKVTHHALFVFILATAKYERDISILRSPFYIYWL
jgi:hypothetical protein